MDANLSKMLSFAGNRITFQANSNQAPILKSNNELSVMIFSRRDRHCDFLNVREVTAGSPRFAAPTTMPAATSDSPASTATSSKNSSPKER